MAGYGLDPIRPELVNIRVVGKKDRILGRCGKCTHVAVDGHVDGTVGTGFYGALEGCKTRRGQHRVDLDLGLDVGRQTLGWPEPAARVDQRIRGIVRRNVRGGYSSPNVILPVPVGKTKVRIPNQ